MLLSKSCEYAIRTALHIAAAEPAAYIAVREISAALGIPSIVLRASGDLCALAKS